MSCDDDWMAAARSATLNALAAMPACCERAGFVYMVAAAGLVKIGRTDDAAKRIASLQASSAVQVTVIALGRGAEIERLLHASFAEHRRHAEWFDGDAVRRWLDDETRPGLCICCNVASSRLKELEARSRPRTPKSARGSTLTPAAGTRVATTPGLPLGVGPGVATRP